MGAGWPLALCAQTTDRQRGTKRRGHQRRVACCAHTAGNCTVAVVSDLISFRRGAGHSWGHTSTMDGSEHQQPREQYCLQLQGHGHACARVHRAFDYGRNQSHAHATSHNTHVMTMPLLTHTHRHAPILSCSTTARGGRTNSRAAESRMTDRTKWVSRRV